MKLVLTMAAIMLIVGFAQASTLKVCPSGCDYTSIQTAVYAAHPNDTIEVHSGTYNESVVLTKNVMFKGTDTGSGEPIVNGDLYKDGFNMVLRGFSFLSIAGLPYPENMTTPNTTIYWIEKALDNPSKPKAIANLNEIVKTNPKDAWAWFRLGWVLADSGRYDESMDALNKSIKLDPYFSSTWNNLGNDFLSLNKYDKALQAYEKAIQLDPSAGIYWANKGDALMALGRTSESNAAYTRASELGYGNSTWTPRTTTISSNATGTNILDHSMASNVDESTGYVITRAYKFSSTDSKAYSWLSLGNVGADTVIWRWYSPDGNQFYIDSVNIPMPTSGAYWSTYTVWDPINVAGSSAANLPGNWHVDVYRNGLKFLTENFSIQGYQQPTSPPITSATTPSPGSEDSVVGKWKLNCDWVCTGSPTKGELNFRDDGTLFDEANRTGKWTRTGDNIHIAWVTGPAVYDGTIQTNTMGGVMSGGTSPSTPTGCWSASKV